MFAPSLVLFICRRSAAEEEAHRQRHCSHRVPGGEHTLRTRHDPVQLPACVCGGAGGECLHWQCHLQGWFWGLAALYQSHQKWPVKLSLDALCNIAEHYLVSHLSLTMPTHHLPQVSVTARDDVPFFGPALPDPAIFKKVSSQTQNSLTPFIFTSIHHKL